MKSKDIFPTRLEQSKRLITEFLQSRKTDRIGIVVYAGKPFTSVPLSYDYKIISKIVEDISSDSIEQNYFLAGTAT
jgi:Ca-activated chloride channel family protein